MAAEDKWQGKATAKVPGVSPDKVWAVIDDYANVYKYLPSIDATTIQSGEPGKLGCVRLCSGPPIPGGQERSLTNEKLVAYDPAERTLSYEVVENNIGFKDFVATIKVLPEEDGSTIEWSFVTPAMPPPHWTEQKVMGYIGYSVNHMAQKIAEELKA
ncbi:lachrymatory-factor synthase-like [Aristolochia californica]|uniref:lachrymatory-factor synthase-like n=1 Tax=Aristolochia californica TaxID=171875 RepID=UPI0035E10043